MIDIPAIKLKVTTLSSGSYRCAVGSNSLTEIITIIPATKPNNVAYISYENVRARMAQPSRAAIGSSNVESKSLR